MRPQRIGDAASIVSCRLESDELRRCSREALEDDFLLLIHPERPRRKPVAAEADAHDVPWGLDVDADVDVVMISDDEDDEDEPPEEGLLSGGFARPDLLRGVAGDSPKAWSHGPPP